MITSTSRKEQAPKPAAEDAFGAEEPFIVIRP